jgi:hypothetical protein
MLKDTLNGSFPYKSEHAHVNSVKFKSLHKGPEFEIPWKERPVLRQNSIAFYK